MTRTRGRKRIVRRMLATAGFPVESLVRTDIGAVALGDQRPGSIRALTRKSRRPVQGGGHVTRSAVVVAVDGPAGTGKSTVSRGLARAMGACHLDTGAMYRMVTLSILRRGVDLADSRGHRGRRRRADLGGIRPGP